MASRYEKSSLELAIEPGRLRHQVQIQSPSTTKDGFGQPQTTWTNVVRTTWASIEEAKGEERYASGQFTAQVTHVITVRWTAAQINPTMRVVFRLKVYKIQFVENIDERDILVKLMCLAVNEGTNAGASNAPAGGC